MVKMKGDTKKRVGLRKPASARTAEFGNGHRSATREWSEMELRANDQFVIRQAEWARRQTTGKAGGNANEVSQSWKGTSEGGDLAEGDQATLVTQSGVRQGEARQSGATQGEAKQTEIRSATDAAMKAATFAESDALFSGANLDLIQNLPVGIAVIWTFNPDDVRTWRIAAANELAKEIIGASLIDFLLTRVAGSFPFEQKMEEIYQSILQRKNSRDLRWMMRESGGVRRTYSVTGFAVGSKYLGILMQDVTAHREIRSALTEHKTRYDEISQAIETFLWKGEPETLQTKWISSEAEKVLGYWREHWSIANFWLEHIEPEDREMVQQMIRTHAATGAKFDYRMKAADGRTVWLHGVIHLSEDVFGQQELTGVMVDITARKVAEEAAHELSRKLLRSQDEERRHVARELHNSLGQYLSVLGMNIGTLARTVDGLSEEQSRIFAETVDLAETCSRELRTVSYLMHPPMLDEVGLIPALEWYVNGFSERSKIQVELDAPQNAPRLPKLVEMAFFRITQEALTNIYRHSRSKTAKIRLHEQDGEFTLEIVDSGAGFEPHVLDGVACENGGPKGVGIRGMRERMRELGGSLEVSSSKRGTSVSAKISRTASVFAKKRREAREEHKEPVKSTG